MSKNDEQIYEKYAETAESPNPVSEAKTITANPIPSIKNKPTAHQDDNAPGIAYGYYPIDIDNLPSGGQFYPAGTKIAIKAATVAEIKQWSTLNEDDISDMDDALNDVLSKCVYVKIPGSLAYSNSGWRDIKDVDRFYLLLGIRELTFTDEYNTLQIPVSETESVVIKKEMLNKINIPEDVMSHYDISERCFIFRTKKTNKIIKMYIPSLGVSQWIKQYYTRKTQSREGFDKAFLLAAPMLIENYRGLADDSYERLVKESASLDINDWTIISYVKDVLTKSVSSDIKYTTEDGVEHTAPLNFRGGIKKMFSGISNTLSDLC